MYRYKAINIGGKKFDEHRVIMSKILDRNLLSKEIVHHKNENGYDNSAENLQIMSLPEHSRMHMQGEKAPWDFYSSANYIKAKKEKNIPKNGES